MAAMSGILEGVRLLDLSQRLAGAYCSRLFAAYGADVIAIEPPLGNPLRQQAELWEQVGAGKRSITLDISKPDGVRLLLVLLEEAAVMVEDFPSGYLDSLGIRFSDLYRVKRRIVLTSVREAAPAGSGALHYRAGLEAFAASAIAVFTADAYDLPQHVEVAAGEVAAVGAALAGASGISTIAPGQPLFSAGFEWVEGRAPELGEHTEAVLCGELGVTAVELAELRGRGVA